MGSKPGSSAISAGANMMRALPWGGRDRSDDAAQQPAQRGEHLHGSQVDRMETTLNSLLSAVASSAGDEEPAPRLRTQTVMSHQSLGAAIAEVARRQKVLEEGPAAPEPRPKPQAEFKNASET